VVPSGRLAGEIGSTFKSIGESAYLSENKTDMSVKVIADRVVELVFHFSVEEIFQCCRPEIEAEL
jgi:hypothetical protein